jgi:hypothetical protein
MDKTVKPVNDFSDMYVNGTWLEQLKFLQTELVGEV